MSLHVALADYIELSIRGQIDEAEFIEGADQQELILLIRALHLVYWEHFAGLMCTRLDHIHSATRVAD